MPVTNANTVVEHKLGAILGHLEATCAADVLAFFGDLLYGVDGVIRDSLESRRRRQKKLVVLLETNGGFVEVVERIANTLRRHYRVVDFLVPDHAMSGGTVLAMSGDAIQMDDYAVLGPIDPQLRRPGGGLLVPALGYLTQYERLIEKSKEGTLTTAELMFLIQKFDPAELYEYEQARELSVTLVKDWLVRYKFKNWKRTRTGNRPVTQSMRRERAEEILNHPGRWHSHGRGIPMKTLKRVLKLEIEDFGRNHELSGQVRTYCRLLTDYMEKRGQGEFCITMVSTPP